MKKNGWTFGIITDGHHSDRIYKIIESIKNQSIENYGIIIIGDKKSNYQETDNTNFLDFDSEGNWDTSKKQKFPISVKKNLIIKNSKYENICFLHDYVLLENNWYSGVRKFEKENNWEIFTNKIYSLDKVRVLDWVITNHPFFYNKTTLIPYHRNLNKYQYIPGYYWCAKKSLMQSNPLNENLSWGEQEDIEWSKRVRLKSKFQFNPYSSVSFLKKKDGIWCSDNKRNRNFKIRSFLAILLFKLRIL